MFAAQSCLSWAKWLLLILCASRHTIFAETLVASSLHITATRLHTSDRRHAQDSGKYSHAHFTVRLQSVSEHPALLLLNNVLPLNRSHSACRAFSLDSTQSPEGAEQRRSRRIRTMDYGKGVPTDAPAMSGMAGRSVGIFALCCTLRSSPSLFGHQHYLHISLGEADSLYHARQQVVTTTSRPCYMLYLPC